MKAGTELDAMVAKHLFGSDDTRTPYSSEIWAAWKVVEKMTQDGWYFDCSFDDCETPRPIWDATFWKPGMTFGAICISGIMKEEGYSLPMTICRHALYVLGVTNETLTT